MSFCDWRNRSGAGDPPHFRFLNHAGETDSSARQSSMLIGVRERGAALNVEIPRGRSAYCPYRCNTVEERFTL